MVERRVDYVVYWVVGVFYDRLYAGYLYGYRVRCVPLLVAQFVVGFAVWGRRCFGCYWGCD